MSATKKASNGITLATSVIAAPAPEAKKPEPVKLKFPVNASQVQQWLNANCGGDPSRAGIRPLNAKPTDGPVVPFLRQAKSARAQILEAHLFGFVNGHKAGEPVPLSGVSAYCKTKFGGAYGLNGFTDVCALLNGGFSPSSKQWGIAYAELVVLPTT